MNKTLQTAEAPCQNSFERQICICYSPAASTTALPDIWNMRENILDKPETCINSTQMIFVNVSSLCINSRDPATPGFGDQSPIPLPDLSSSRL